MDLTILDSRLVVALVSAGIGAFLTFLVQQIVNKRGLFIYFVRHNKIGESTDDAVFGGPYGSHGTRTPSAIFTCRPLNSRTRV